jgi:Sensors of blue-light using FAD
MALSGTSALYRLVYRSTGMGVLSGADLDRILLRAKASNAGAGITGLMLFNEGTFLQALEEPPASVLSPMETIR